MVGFSVNEVEIFTRRVSPLLSEAVDFFWVARRAPMQNLPIGSTDVRRLEQCLIDLLQDAAIALPERSSAVIQAASESSTRIRFVADPAQHCTSLEIDTDDRPGLLLAICQTLFAASLQIIGSHAKTVDGRARGRFDVVELDERPMAEDRRQELQMLVLSAIDELGRPAVLSAGG
jgi:UTP:GlnB (protein PII) uridylyltransferase